MYSLYMCGVPAECRVLNPKPPVVLATAAIWNEQSSIPLRCRQNLPDGNLVVRILFPLCCIVFLASCSRNRIFPLFCTLPLSRDALEKCLENRHSLPLSPVLLYAQAWMLIIFFLRGRHFFNIVKQNIVTRTISYCSALISCSGIWFYPAAWQYIYYLSGCSSRGHYFVLRKADLICHLRGNGETVRCTNVQWQI